MENKSPLTELAAQLPPDWKWMALFHTPEDSAAMTGPAALEPVARAFAATLREIVGKPGH